MDDYYIDMSAAAEGKISGLKTPLLAVSAVDDPITTPERSPMDEIAQVDDLYFLLTRCGGVSIRPDMPHLNVENVGGLRCFTVVKFPLRPDLFPSPSYS